MIKALTEQGCTVDQMADTGRQTTVGETLPASEVLSSDSTMGSYTIRRFCSDDAAGVTRLVEVVYGDTYYPRDLYYPHNILPLNSPQHFVSVFPFHSS